MVAGFVELVAICGVCGSNPGFICTDDTEKLFAAWVPVHAGYSIRVTGDCDLADAPARGLRRWQTGNKKPRFVQYRGFLLVLLCASKNLRKKTKTIGESWLGGVTDLICTHTCPRIGYKGCFSV